MSDYALEKTQFRTENGALQQQLTDWNTVDEDAMPLVQNRLDKQ